MEKEKWKEEVLRSLDGAQRAEPGDLLYHNIRAKVLARQMQVLRRPYLAAIAAGLALLISANVWVLNRQQQPTTVTTSTYQIDPAHFDLY